LQGVEDETEAARRLFYVAITRAEAFLQISYSEKDEDGKPQLRTQFIDEILSENVVIAVQHVTDAAVIQSQMLLLSENTAPEVAPLPKHEAAILLQDFVMSATALCRYLDCPLSFYYENVLNVPYSSSEAAAYGTAVHYALRRLGERAKGEVPLSVEGFLHDFETELERQKIFLTQEQFERRLMLGRRDLPIYFKNRVSFFTPKNLLEVELDVRNVVVQGVPLKGSIDKIERLDKQKVRVIDYKTGKLYKDKLQPPTQNNPLGGDYWRQVVFYKILLENYQAFQWQVVEGKIDYIEPDSKTKEVHFKPIDLHPTHVNTVLEQITHTYKQIKDHNFYKGCGKSTCHWCQFTEQQKLRNRYISSIGEELDE
jgi:DNA helicase-2/ATP-dependent DNA helicase PcrA